jgi:hypothetical protein
MRIRLVLVFVTALLTFLVTWGFLTLRHKPIPIAPSSVQVAATPKASNDTVAPTRVYAHNLMLRKGPDFRFYVRWLKGQMIRTQRNVNPSFDDPDSFTLNITTGVLRANIGDITNYLNKTAAQKSPLKNISLSGDGSQIKLRGTLHKVVPLPVEMIGTISPADENRIHIHVEKISVLKIPMKAIMGGFHVTIADFFASQQIPGIEVKDNDLFFDTQQLLPPPHIRGQLTKVRIANPDLEEVYGNGQEDVDRVEQWRNFLRLSDGTIDFGKLTMRHVDLIMIDVSKDAWFDLDLTNYQAQLVNGTTRMTPAAGLQIFMPDLRDIPQNQANKNISIEWLKNRNAPPPADVMKK